MCVCVCVCGGGGGGARWLYLRECGEESSNRTADQNTTQNMQWLDGFRSMFAKSNRLSEVAVLNTGGELKPCHTWCSATAGQWTASRATVAWHYRERRAARWCPSAQRRMGTGSPPCSSWSSPRSIQRGRERETEKREERESEWERKRRERERVRD